jgi:hypothetical protein
VTPEQIEVRADKGAIKAGSSQTWMAKKRESVAGPTASPPRRKWITYPPTKGE